MTFHPDSSTVDHGRTVLEKHFQGETADVASWSTAVYTYGVHQALLVTQASLL